MMTTEEKEAILGPLASKEVSQKSKGRKTVNVAELIKQKQLEKEKGLGADGDDQPAAGLEIDGDIKADKLSANMPEAPVVKFSESYFKKEEVD